MSFMASSKDFEKLWSNYQEVVKSKEISIVDYCQRNGFVYAQFERWYRKNIKGVSIVKISTPNDRSQTPSERVVTEQQTESPNNKIQVVYVSIELSSGLKISQKSIDYSRLKMLVEKLEGLC